MIWESFCFGRRCSATERAHPKFLTPNTSQSSRSHLLRNRSQISHSIPLLSVILATVRKLRHSAILCSMAISCLSTFCCTLGRGFACQRPCCVAFKAPVSTAIPSFFGNVRSDGASSASPLRLRDLLIFPFPATESFDIIFLFILFCFIFYA